MMRFMQERMHALCQERIKESAKFRLEPQPSHARFQQH